MNYNTNNFVNEYKINIIKNNVKGNTNGHKIFIVGRKKKADYYRLLIINKNKYAMTGPAFDCERSQDWNIKVYVWSYATCIDLSNVVHSIVNPITTINTYAVHNTGLTCAYVYLPSTNVKMLNADLCKKFLIKHPETKILNEWKYRVPI
jgi:hypothetical protein